MTGSAGCNSYFGAYELRGDSITVGLVGSTEMACVGPEGVMDQEQEYLKFLSQARTFRLSDDQLYIYWDDHDALTFEPQ